MVRIVFLSFLLLSGSFLFSQHQYAVDTLVYHGDHDKMVDFVILADGYTDGELDKYSEDARTFIDYFFETDPIRSYKTCFNVFAIRTVSKESGAIHNCIAEDCPTIVPTEQELLNKDFKRGVQVPKSNPETIFGARFDAGNIHRLVVVDKHSLIDSILSTHVAESDLTLVLVNSPYYGGSGGKYAVSTVNKASNAIAIHEIAHSFAGLADEYWAGLQYQSEEANSTMMNHPDSVAWKHWMGVDGVGIYVYGRETAKANWYRPHEYCKMQVLDAEFCRVCQEQFVHKIQKLTSPILRRTPSADTLNVDSAETLLFSAKLNSPFPNSLSLTWNLNDVELPVKGNSLRIEPALLQQGLNSLELLVKDESQYVRNSAYLEDAQYKTKWVLNLDSPKALKTPDITWSDSIETCYGSSQVLNISAPSAGVVYQWYKGANDTDVLAEGLSFRTPPIIENTTYFVQATYNGLVSARKRVTVICLPKLDFTGKVKIKKKKGLVQLAIHADKLGVDEGYIWYGPDAKPLRNWNEQVEQYERANVKLGALVLKEEDFNKGVWLRKKNLESTCLGPSYSVAD